jgi:hypothetical protein
MSNPNIGDWNGPIEAHCKKCGKEFYPTPYHVYKDSKGKYCCWTCFNHRKDGKTPQYQQIECLYSDGTVVKTFQSPTKASEWVGGIPRIIKRSCEEHTEYKGYYWRFKV